MTLSNLRRIASMIDKEVRASEASGTAGSQLVTRLARYLQDLQGIWESCTAAQLELLYQTYPGFARYASFVESVGRGEVHGEASIPIARSPGLDAHRDRFASMATEAEAIESAFQAILDSGKPPGWRTLAGEWLRRFSVWSNTLAGLRREIHRGQISNGLRPSMLLLERHARKLGKLAGKIRGRPQW